MRALIIVPVHNEESNILQCLESLENQSFHEFKCIVVNDGSTDNSQKIVEQFVVKINRQESKKFNLISLEKSPHSPGAKVVKAFNRGLKNQNLSDFDFICKFDADIIFPENYLQKIADVYNTNPKAGMVSGLVQVLNQDEKWVFEEVSSKNHVRGPIKSYRTECFRQIGGLRSVLGWDNLDVMLAEMRNWEVITIKDLFVKHLRPTGFKYKNESAEKMGTYFYNIGLSFPLAVLSAAKYSYKNHSAMLFFRIMRTFLSQSHQREITNEEMKFIRKLRWKSLFKQFQRN